MFIRMSLIALAVGPRQLPHSQASGCQNISSTEKVSGSSPRSPSGSAMIGLFSLIIPHFLAFSTTLCLSNHLLYCSGVSTSLGPLTASVSLHPTPATGLD